MSNKFKNRLKSVIVTALAFVMSLAVMPALHSPTRRMPQCRMLTSIENMMKKMNGRCIV